MDSKEKSGIVMEKEKPAEIKKSGSHSRKAGNQIKTLGKESLIYGVSTVLARFLNFFLTPFYTYYLPAGQYGIVAAAYSYIAFMNILYHYALDQAYMRHSADRELAFSAALKFQFCTTAFLTFALCAFASFWAGLGGIAIKYVYYSAAILVLDTLTLIPFADMRMQHKAKKFAFIKSLGIILNVLIVFIMIGSLGCGIDAVFQANIAASLFQACLLMSEFKLFRLKNMPGTKKILLEMLRYAWPLFIAGAGTMIVQIFDRPVMLKAMDEEALGIYQAAAKLGIFMQLLVNMFDTAWRAFVIERIGQKDAPHIFAKVFTYFTAFGLAAWLFLSFFIADIVQLKIFGKSLFGPAYWGALNLLPIFFGANLLYGAYVNLLAPVIVTKKTWISLCVTLTSAVLSILGNILLIPLLGMKGGALALLISYAVMCIMMFLMCRRIYAIPYEFRKTAILAIAAAACFILGIIAPSAFSLPARIACALLFPAVIWNAGFFSKDEKAAIRAYLKKRILRK
ncbi:MAG: oligosaccharide flippase family protein [Elusimicrobiales bacterium]|nr:oligosaccharide flippase family protein [Elusimicrobiales bacterium]